MLFYRKKLGPILWILLVTLSCSTPRPEGKTEAEVLLHEAQGLVKDNRFLLATEKLNTIRSKFPYSYYATHAELLQADILLKQENYVESAAAFILFKDFHPHNKKIPYVVWKIAESYYFQLPSTFDRDLTPGHQAIKYYEMLLREYPTSEYVKDARKKIEHCQEMIKKKEKYIADFYFKTDVFDAARFRYLDIIKRFYGDEMAGHAMVRVLKSSLHLKDYKGCLEYYSSYRLKIKKQYKSGLEKAYQKCQILGRETKKEGSS